MMVDLNKTILTSELLREKFKNSGLSYKYINSTQVALLINLINEELKDTTIWLQKPIVEFDLTNHGGIKFLYLNASSDSFKDREGISFNKDGYRGCWLGINKKYHTILSSV